MSVIITSRNTELKPILSTEYREDVFLSPTDAMRYGIRHGEYGLLTVTHYIIDLPGNDYPIRINIKDSGEMPSNELLVNSLFFEDLHFGVGQEWELHRVERYQPIQRLTLEPSVEQERLREDLKRMRRSSFSGRCLLVRPNQVTTDLSLRVSDQAYFNIHDISPLPNGIQQPTVFGVEDSTEISVFVPHRKGGVDMIIVVDASGSMDHRDYVTRSGEVLARIEGARRALKTLLQRRLYEGSRVSRMALVAFGQDAQVIYPVNKKEMVELTEHDIEAMIRSIPQLTRSVDRNGTDIAEAMDIAADLLFNNAREDNEKIIVLLSDGGHWKRETGADDKVESVIGKDDPVMFADNLYDEGQIRIHTVAISNAENVRRYLSPQYVGKVGITPNPDMLEAISQRTRGKFFDSPDADILNKLFEDLGKGAIFPLT